MTDHAVFCNDAFDAKDYANAILAGENYPHDSTKSTKSKSSDGTKEDISLAISKLTFGIDDTNKQIKSLVTEHHTELLQQAERAEGLVGSLQYVRGGLDELDSSLAKLRTKISGPYEALQKRVSQLERLKQASDVLRRTSRFIVLGRRLETQMAEMNTNLGGTSFTQTLISSSREDVESTPLENEDDKERAIAKAALSIAELGALLDDSVDHAGKGGDAGLTDTIPLRSLNVVAIRVPFVEQAREKVTIEMQTMVVAGLNALNQPVLASSLQTGYNLRVLPELVQGLVFDLSDAVGERISSALDIAKISKEVFSNDPQPSSQGLLYKSRIRTEPTTGSSPQWALVLWSRLENLIEELSSCCIKVYTLEKVLKLKKDAITGVSFLEEAMKVLENKPSGTFWSAVGQELEKHMKSASKNSTFLQKTLSTSYPRLLRLFHDFFAKIAVHSDTVYTAAKQSPETIIILHALLPFETAYITRMSTRINESIGQSFSGGSRTPGKAEGLNVARAITTELEISRFDNNLLKQVSKIAASALTMFLSRIDSMTSRERNVGFVGPVATSGQQINASLSTCLFHCATQLEKSKENYPEAIYAILQHPIEAMRSKVYQLFDPLIALVRREFAAIIARLHRIDFSQPFDSLSDGGGGPSLYMKDLAEKLNFIKVELLDRFDIGDIRRQNTIDTAKYVARVFVLQASIAKPLGESGKLQLASDMTELEFSLNAFVSDSHSKRSSNLDLVGDEYKALRAMRPLLFLDNESLASPQHTIGLSPLIVLHHILVRSPISLPHALHGWQEAEYVKWVEEHTQEESWSLIESCLTHWEKISEVEESESMDSAEYLRLASAVLKAARSSIVAAT